MNFGVVASDGEHNTKVSVNVLIIDPDRVALFTVSKEVSEVINTLAEFVR